MTLHSEQFLQLLDDLCLVLTPEFHIQEVNRIWTQQLGWPAPNSELPRLLDFVHPEEQPRLLVKLSQLHDGQPLLRLDFRLRTRAEEFRWFRFRGMAGTAGSLLLMGTDVHHDKEREALLELFFESSSVGLNLCALDGTWIRSNPCFLEMLGYSQDEADGKLNYWQVTPSKYQAAEEQQLRSLRAEGRYGPYEKEFIRADGSLVPVRLNGFMIQNDGQPFIWSIIENISKERSLLTELAAKSALFEAMVENVPAALFVKDCRDDFRVTLWNHAAEEVFRRPRSTVVGKTCHEVWPKAQADLYLRDDEQVVSEDRLVDIPEEPSATPEGDTLYLHTRKVPLHVPPDETPSLLLCISEDITARKLLESQLRAAIEARDDFLSVASHELKTPLTTLSLKLQVLSSLHHSPEPPPREKMKALIDKSLEATRRLNELIGELLDITRLRAGKLRLNKEEMELGALLQELLALMAEEIQRSGSSIRLHAPHPIFGKWDKTRLNQVFSNLISNALKFGEGKSIDIGLKPGTDGMSVQLEVRDHGRGIPSELQNAIFERFRRGESSDQVAGLGLGLYIVRQLVEAHGGSIRVESAPGRGAAFIVRLPLLSSDDMADPAIPALHA